MESQSATPEAAGRDRPKRVNSRHAGAIVCFPVFEFDKDQTRRTRVEIDDFLKTTGASLWIQHDFIANRRLRKSPAFYD